MSPATCDQLVVAHFGEPSNFLAIRSGEWFARVTPSRRRLADQANLVCLNPFLFHHAAKSPERQRPAERAWRGKALPRAYDQFFARTTAGDLKEFCLCFISFVRSRHRS